MNTIFAASTQIKEVAEQYGTPAFVYSEKVIIDQAQTALKFNAPFGLTVRYAMKANPNAHIVRLITSQGLDIDASSGYEAERAMRAGVSGERIMLTSQELAHNLKELVEQGVQFNATSLHQLEAYGKLFPNSQVSVRINPGLGSGGTNRTNTGGPASSFGVWHEYIARVKEVSRKYGLTVSKIHTHVGSGSDPSVWQKVARMSLDIVEQFPDAKTISLGGGYKVARVEGEVATDLNIISRPIDDLIRDFAERTGRKLHVEIEPGTYMVANAGILISRIQDIVDTGSSGYTFLKLDAGMTELMRPSLYGAQHPISVISTNTAQKEYVVVGHCCESGDILTPQPGDPEALATRSLAGAVIGDLATVGGVGAYGLAMAAQGYNSFPAAPEVMISENGQHQLIRRRQTLDELIATEA